MNRQNRLHRCILFLKSTVRKLVTVPGYTRRDGTYVPPHQKTVHVAAAGPVFEDHLIPDTNSNAGTHNKKIAKIKELHAAGDAAALSDMKFGVNTYGKKQAKVAEAAVQHLTTPVEPAAPAVEAPVIDWEKYKLPATNTNAPSHNKKVEAIKQLHVAGDHDGLLAMKHGSNTYAKKQALLAAVAAAHIKEFGPASKPEKAPQSSREKHFGEQHEGQVFADGSGSLIKFENGVWTVDMEGDGHWFTPPQDSPLVASWSTGIGFEDKPLEPHVAHALDAVDSPKEGDTKAGADGMLVFHNGRWHKQGKGQVGAPQPAAGGSGPPMTVFHNTADGHNKFWAIGLDGTKVTKKWGAIGSKGQSKVWTYHTEDEAKAAFNSSTLEKVNGGYKIQIDQSSEAPPASAAPAPVDLASALDAVPVPSDITSGKTAALAAIKKAVLEQGLDGFKLFKKQITKKKYSGQKKLTITVKVPEFGYYPNKFNGFVSLDEAGEPYGTTSNGKQVVAMLDYVNALKVAHAKATGGKAPKASAPKATAATKPAPKIVIPTASSLSKKVDGLSVAIIDKWEKTGEQKGSNPGGTYKDAAGQEWYVKFPQSADHAKNELLAAKLYEAAGVAVPKLKLVERGGKVGIASKLVEGVSKVGPGIKDAEDALEGFAVDAWLANYDSVGTGYDNLLKTKDGKAIRIDVGGSLIYRAQGAPKADFGDVVGEIDGMRDPKKNSYAAAVFGGISPETLDLSVAKVLKIPDEYIEGAVEKFGPGTAADKKALAAKLIARKAYLAKKYPNASSAKPKPVFKPDLLTPPPSFANWKGPGVGLSSKPHVNAANDTAVQAAYDAAKQGNLDAVKNAKSVVVDKDSGAVTGEVPLKDSKSQHVAAYWADLVNEVDFQLNPPDMPFIGNLSAGESLDDIAACFQPIPSGQAVKAVSANQKAGRYIILGEAGDMSDEIPAEDNSVIGSTAWKTAAAAHYANAPASAKSSFSTYVTTAGARALNTALRKGEVASSYNGKTVEQHVKDMRDLMVDVPQGSTFVRNMGNFGYGEKPSDTLIKGLQQFLLDAPAGTIVQEPGFSSTSWAPHGGILNNNDIQWQFTAGPGVKMFPGWLTANTGEGEGLLPPNQRYLIVGAEKVGKTVKVRAVLLPTNLD